MDEALQRARDFVNRKRVAYHQTFCGDRAGPHASGSVVLADLKKFARIDGGGLVVSPVTRMTDPYATAYRAGLRDMYLRIAGMLELDETNTFTQPEEPPHERAATAE